MSEFLQLHLLTSYPPANLNRDDLGRPKTASFGNTQRLRISSQSLKRAWRCSSVFQSEIRCGTRTKDIGNSVFDQLTEKKVDPERADEVAKAVADVFGKLKPAAKKGKAKKEQTEQERREEDDARKTARQTEQLVHFSLAELEKIDALVAKVAGGHTPDAKEYEALLDASPGTADIALFGRMLAKKPEFNVEAAAQVAHAITVNPVAVEDDFFTAVDDLNKGDEDRGAGHMGSTEFGSGLFYLYVCINRDLLMENLGSDKKLASRTLDALCKAVCTVSPTGKQNSFASRAYASYCLAERGPQQPRSLSVAFLKDIRHGDLLGNATLALEETRSKMEKVYGKCSDETFVFNAAVTGDKGDKLVKENTLEGLCDFAKKGLA